MSNNVLDNSSLFSLLYKMRKKIILVSFLSAVFAAIASLFITNKYKSEVILFPTMNLSTGKALLNEYNDFLEIGEEEELEHMMQILQSNEIFNRVIGKFDLVTHYNIDTNNELYFVDLMKEYHGNVKSEITKYSSIKISVLDEDPQMAADIANEIASLIDTVMNNLQKNMAKQGYESLMRDRDFVPSVIPLTVKVGTLFPFLYPHSRGISPPSVKAELVSLRFPICFISIMLLLNFARIPKRSYHLKMK